MYVVVCSSSPMILVYLLAETVMVFVFKKLYLVKTINNIISTEHIFAVSSGRCDIFLVKKNQEIRIKNL